MKKYIWLIPILSILSGCQNHDPVTPAVDASFNKELLLDFSKNIAQAVYNDLLAKTTLLDDQVATLSAARTDENLTACRTTWRAARMAWEQSEGHLLGPVATDNIDPRIDTWPVNFSDLDAQLASADEFTEEYIDNLEDALKGFHPIEYLLFGEDGEKVAADLTDREMEYLSALSFNLKKLTTELSNSWDDQLSTSYYNEFADAGDGSTVYATQRAAFEELVNAMAGICDEVANGKISEPLNQQDASLEESPFAKSSITDFKNNITGAQNVYLGKYQTDGKGLEDLVKKYNLQLDGTIKEKFGTALAALNNITDPFGEAIFSQTALVETAIAAINDLAETLNDELLPFVRVHAK